MTSRTHWIGFMIVASIVTSVAWAGPKAARTPDKAQLALLAPPVVVGPYQIQPPKGYTHETQHGPSGSIGEVWIGTPRKDDHTRPYLMLVTLTLPAGDETTYTLQQVAAKMLAGFERRRKNWKQSPFETVQVNGLTFIKVNWQGVDTERGLPMHGFSWVAHDGNVFLQLSSQDIDPHSKTALPLAEAAALTFRKHL